MTNDKIKPFLVQPLWFAARGGIDDQTVSIDPIDFNISTYYLELLTTKKFKESLSLYFKLIYLK